MLQISLQDLWQLQCLSSCKLYHLIWPIVQQEVLDGLRVPFLQKLAILVLACALLHIHLTSGYIRQALVELSSCTMKVFDRARKSIPELLQLFPVSISRKSLRFDI